MEAEEVRRVIETYRRKFVEMKVGKTRFPHEKVLTDQQLGFEHCHWMLDEMEGFIKEERMDKVNRWLGFIQGFLWSNQVYALTEMMNHNRNQKK